jgi:3-deoxy-D-manno-octulosonate 8-phosphate phosphatase (KDO 8-P phosphatase)
LKGDLMMPKLAATKLLILDVDGVLTDGRFILTEGGEEFKAFNAKDGHGLRMLLSAGIDVVIISGRSSRAVDHRARDLDILEVYQGIKEKETLLLEIIEKKRLTKEEVCCVGDDLPDLPLFSHAGVSVAVADAVTEVREAATFTTKSRGGYGAVREVCEAILKAKNLWPHPSFSDVAPEK